MPSGVMVPTALVPPGVPFAAQVTRVSVVLPTAALNACVFPSRSIPLAGVTFTVIASGGGGGAGEAAPPPHPAQQRRAATKAIAAHGDTAILGGPLSGNDLSFCGRGRMPRRIAGELPAAT